MNTHYTFDTSRSKFTVQAFATGMLSFLGHSPTFAVPDFSGAISFDPDDPLRTTLMMRVNADSLTLLDRVSESDRKEV